ncbi:conserved unknown protein [Ectocarpus siliculosus]|uniref:Rho-GAP domain-containing protein n=1 Tax=Ectocarpus siliculosus TaxID=2880 RepID=D7G3V4_ECTSI|nr:conserved unknown protein [Ectocarpus siliculosus]|eukprot:CBJ33631.1 conserved unknown protein [Ectocarpus siliculosus]
MYMVGEKAILKIGLAAPSNDANTGDIEQPLHSFVQMRDGLKDIQAQVRNYVLAMEGLFGAAHNMTFLFAPLSGETAKQLKLSLCRVAVQDAMIRGLTEYLEAPLKAVLDFCDGIDLLAKRRGQLLLDYGHHKRKHEAVEARRESGKGGDMEEEVKARSTKLNASIDNLKDCTTQILAQVAALSKASLSAFETDFVESTDMRDYVMNLQSTTTTLENSMPLPPLGEHVAFLRNALIHDVHEVATLLKMYFRELPEPVVPTAFYYPMLEASVKDLTEFVETVRVLVAQLPEINRTCVRLLFAFLLRVSLLSAENLMTTENLGIVFAPNLLRAPNATEMNVMDLQRAVVRLDRKDNHNTRLHSGLTLREGLLLLLRRGVSPRLDRAGRGGARPAVFCLPPAGSWP